MIIFLHNYSCQMSQQQPQLQSCFTTIFIGKSKRRFQNLFNYLFDKSPSEIYEILERMNHAQLMRFLNFTVLHV